MYENTYCVHNVHNSTVVGRGGGGYLRGLLYYFLVFSNFHFQNGVQVIIGLKLKIRIITKVIKVIKDLKLSAQVIKPQFPVKRYADLADQNSFLLK